DDFRFPTLDLPILSRLWHFIIQSDDPANIFFDSLEKYAIPNRKLCEIVLINIMYRITYSHREMFTSISHRIFGLKILFKPEMHDLISKVTNLTNLILDCWQRFDFVQHLTAVAQLPHLHTLSMTFNLKNR